MPRLATSCLLVLLGTGCAPKIGDPCDDSLDCSTATQARQCDRSFLAPAGLGERDKGECTIENCTYGSCPREAACVQHWGNDFYSVSCDPEAEDTEWIPDPDWEGEGEAPEILVDRCGVQEICLPEGLCAPLSGARTSCRLTCDSDADCRSAYRCQKTGFDGIYIAPDPDDPNVVHAARICVPDR